MGVDNSSTTIIGLPNDKFIEEYQKSTKVEDAEEIIDQLLDDGELDYASPWYDSSRDYWVIGYASSYLDITTNEFTKEITETKERFIKDFGFEPKVFVSAHVY